MDHVVEGKTYIQKSGMISVAASWPPWHAIILVIVSPLCLKESSFVKRDEDIGIHGTQGVLIWTNNIKLSLDPDT